MVLGLNAQTATPKRAEKMEMAEEKLILKTLIFMGEILMQ